MNLLEELLRIISSVISGFALMWAIYSFVLKRRDKKADLDRQSFLLTSQAEREAIGNRILAIETQLKENQKELETFRIAITQATERMAANKEINQMQYERIEKTLCRYEDKLDSFGKVIIK